MEIFKTIQTCIFKNQSKLILSQSREGIWFIHLESPGSMVQMIDGFTQYLPKKEMLYNGLNWEEVNNEFHNLKCNPLITGE